MHFSYSVIVLKNFQNCNLSLVSFFLKFYPSFVDNMLSTKGLQFPTILLAVLGTVSLGVVTCICVLYSRRMLANRNHYDNPIETAVYETQRNETIYVNKTEHHIYLEIGIKLEEQTTTF